MREELSSATTKQQKAEQDREEAEMKIAEVSSTINEWLLKLDEILFAWKEWFIKNQKSYMHVHVC